MRRMNLGLAVLLLVSSAGYAGNGVRPSGQKKNQAVALRTSTREAPRIEVLFVLDTTGSMGGLIEGAKLKIWSIANQMMRADPRPQLRVGLLGYRDRGDAYITQFTDLSEDMDTIYARLREFQAGGGGDTPESVNQALQEAVNRPSWSQESKVLKIVFLVGDAPPHMDYANDVQYPISCRQALKRDLIINTIQCGQMVETMPFWKEIAQLGGGTYIPIGQTGDMQVISTPMDTELAKLNAEVGKTIVAYGAEPLRAEVKHKQAMMESVAAAAPSVAADRLAFNAATSKVVQGGGDLLDGIKNGDVRIDKLDAKKLPTELQKLSAEEQKSYLQKKAAERNKIQARIAELSRSRQAFIDTENQNRVAAGKGESFDLKVAEVIRDQATRKQIKFGGGRK